MNYLSVAVPLCALTVCLAHAGQDPPQGEVHPRIVADGGDPKIVLSYRRNEDYHYRIALLTESGSIGDSVRISEDEAANRLDRSPPGIWVERDKSTFVFGMPRFVGPAGSPRLFHIRENRPHPIILNLKDDIGEAGNFFSFLVTDKHFVLLSQDTYSDVAGLRAGRPRDLVVFMFDRETLDEDHRIQIGGAVCMGGSFIFETEGKMATLGSTVYLWWLKPSEDALPSLMLSEISPSARHRSHVIQVNAPRNLTAYIATINEEVLVAYDYPSDSSHDRRIQLYRHRQAEQGDVDQPAACPKSIPAGDENLESESEVRPQ